MFTNEGIPAVMLEHMGQTQNRSRLGRQKKITGGYRKMSGHDSDIKPQWRYQRMTEVFGMCGEGWNPSLLTIILTRHGRQEAYKHLENLWKQYMPLVRTVWPDKPIWTSKQSSPPQEEWSAGIPAVGGSMD